MLKTPLALSGVGGGVLCFVVFRFHFAGLHSSYSSFARRDLLSSIWRGVRGNWGEGVEAAESLSW